MITDDKDKENKEPANNPVDYPDLLLQYTAKKFKDTLEQREVQALIEGVKTIGKDPTKRSRVIPDQQQTESTPKDPLTFIRSKFKKSPSLSDGSPLKKSGKKKKSKQNRRGSQPLL